MEDSSKKEYCRVPLSIIIKYGDQIPFELFIKLSDAKLIKVSNESDNVKEIVVKYLNKGLKEIFADKKGYSSFIEWTNRDMCSQFFEGNMTAEEKINFLESGYNLMKESFRKIGIREPAITLSKTLAIKTLSVVKNIDNVRLLFDKFKDQCDNEYIKAMFIGSVVVSMIDTFEWETEQVKERAIQAILLRDIMLAGDDFKDIKDKVDNPKGLSTRIRNHPIETVKLLTEDNCKEFATDVLTVIEQHHERPEGLGFPSEIDHKRVILLSAVHIVADEFVEKMIQYKFDIDKRLIVFNELIGYFKKGNYRKALDALNVSIGL